MEHTIFENTAPLNELGEAMDTEDSFACITPMDTNPIVSNIEASEGNVMTSVSSVENRCDDIQTQIKSSDGYEKNIDKKLSHESPNIDEMESEIKMDLACPLTGLKSSVESNADFSVDNKKKNCSLTDEKKIANLRKNIRDVMGENQLDSNTLEAQREESERLARVAEQQKIIREYQRQTAVNKQNVRTKNRVISLLQSGTTFAKITDVTEESQQEKVLRDCYGPIINRNKLVEKDVKDDDIDKSTKCSSKALYTPDLPINDVVTIEDSSSEDDCILLSDDEENDLEEETEDDPNNSGLHVKDVYNVVDEEGRVVVNVGHPQGEEDIFIAPQIAKTIKPHQIGGVRFLFDNIIESTKRFNSSTGFGCILAHSMGLGKTLQVVCFCDIILRHTDSKTILCVMPINTLQNWMAEFDMWLPKQSDNPENVRPRNFNVFVLNDQQKTLSARAKVILKWSEEGGVLLMGYELFRLLALKLIPNRKRKVGKTSIGNEKVETEAHKRLSESIYQSLVKPGPDLVICDEGHRIKNSHAGISLALKQIRTRRRIVLTGYPLQNNLLEYWCMVDFVRPNYLGTRTEFSNMFERPIQNGQCIDSTPEDIKFMRYRAHVLHSLLVGFVQRRSHLVLEHTLPQKLEYVILTKMTSFQRKLYETFMNDVVRKKTVPNPLKAFAVCCKIWNHPDVLYNFLKKRETELDLEIDDVDGSADISASLKGSLKKSEKLPPNNEDENNKFEKSEITSLQKVEDSKQELENTSIKNDQCYDYLCQNNYQYSQPGLFSSESNENSFWQDPNATYYGYPSLCSNMGSPIRPDYVGMVVKKSNEQENTNSSSQIVDLDTKEIKTVETDIDITINQVVNNVSYHAKKPLFSNDREKSPDIANSNSTKSTMNLESSNNVGLVEGVEKETFKAKGDDGIPYDWAIDLMKGYEPILVSNSPKMQIFLCILNESIKQGDRVLLFSQSLLTLNLIESFLQLTPIPTTNKCWAKNESYFRLDGSTSSQEREKLVNEFNCNPDLLLFLISTKAGSLGINLVGANRVVVFDASWNPCHDTQAVYRIYRYGQQKPCFVYRIVMDKCLEKKIYDRQVKKQGMSNRVVDECNPDAHLSMKDVTNLCYDYDNEQKQSNIEFAKPIDSYSDVIIQKMLSEYKDALSKEPFYHESLLVDRKEKKLSLAEKRQAQRSYEMEKKAASKQVFNYNTNKLQYRIFRNDGSVITRPVASVRPMQTAKSQNLVKASPIRSTRWIPAEVWQRQGMTAQEMTLPLDVVIPTNSSDKTNIILKSGQRVMVLKSPKGIYMQLESGKIIAIRTSSKMNQPAKTDKDNVIDITAESSISPNKNSSTRDTKGVNSVHNSAASTFALKEIGSVKPNVKNLNNDKKEKNKIAVNDESDLNSWSDSKKDIPQVLSQKVLKSVLIQKKQATCQDLNFNKNTARKTNTDGNQRINEKSTTEKNTAQNIFSNAPKLSLSTNLEKLRGAEMHTSEIPEKKSSQSSSYGCADKYAGQETEIFQSSAFSATDDVKDFCDSKTENLNNDDQDQTKLEYMRKSTSQCLTAQESSTQSSLNQQYSHQPSLTQQKDSYASGYNLQLSNYSSKPPQVCVDNVPSSAYVTNPESLPHTQFFDSMYDNGVSPTYDHSNRFPNYATNAPYTNFQQHFHPHLHNLGNLQSSSIGAHPYYMRWPPMSTISHPPNQHSPMYSSPYSQNESSAYQWHNQR